MDKKIWIAAATAPLLALCLGTSGAHAINIITPSPATWTEPLKTTGTSDGALKGLTTRGCKVWAVGEEGNTPSGPNKTWIEYSPNGGRTWTLQNNPTPLVTLNKVAFPSDSIGFAVGEPAEHPNASDRYAGAGTILRTFDGGRSWYDLTKYSAPVGPGIIEDLEGLSVLSPTNAYIAGSRYSNYYESDTGVILHTTNGFTYTAQTLPTTEGIADVYFANATRGWAVTDGGTILSTVNGGIGARGWTIQHPSSSNNRDAERIKFAPNGLTGIVIGGYGYYATTSDGGATWVERRYGIGDGEIGWAPPGMKDVTFTDNNHVLIAAESYWGGTAILESFNGGQTLVTDFTPEGDNMQGIGALPNGAAIAVGADRHALLTGSSGC